MESKRLRLTPGMARVEFLAVKDEVESLLARGYLLKPAYAQLTKEKRISMTYDTFRRYARKYFPDGKNEQAGKLKRTDTRSKHSPGAENSPVPGCTGKKPTHDFRRPPHDRATKQILSGQLRSRRGRSPASE